MLKTQLDKLRMEKERTQIDYDEVLKRYKQARIDNEDLREV